MYIVHIYIYTYLITRVSDYLWFSIYRNNRRRKPWSRAGGVWHYKGSTRRVEEIRHTDSYRFQESSWRFTLWLFNIAMGNGPFIDGLPIKNGDFPWRTVSHNQMVSGCFNRLCAPNLEEPTKCGLRNILRWKSWGFLDRQMPRWALQCLQRPFREGFWLNNVTQNVVLSLQSRIFSPCFSQSSLPMTIGGSNMIQ